jgi:hypothetical protein
LVISPPAGRSRTRSSPQCASWAARWSAGTPIAGCSRACRPAGARRRAGSATSPTAAQEHHARTQTGGQAPRRPSPSRAHSPPAARSLARARGPRQAPHDRRGRRRPRARRTLLGTRDHGVAATTNSSARRAHRRNDARSDPRERCEQPQPAALDARERHRSSSRTPGHAAPTRAYESRHDVDDSRCAPPAEPNPANNGVSNR